MVVKASTKPWPRQLGSSILRALPPLVKPGRVRPARVKSSQVRGGGGMAHGAGDAHRAGRGARIARVRPSQVEHEWCLSARVATQLPKRGSQWAVAPGCKATLPPCVTSGRGKPSQLRSSQVRSARDVGHEWCLSTRVTAQLRGGSSGRTRRGSTNSPAVRHVGPGQPSRVRGWSYMERVIANRTGPALHGGTLPHV